MNAIDVCNCQYIFLEMFSLNHSSFFYFYGSLRKLCVTDYCYPLPLHSSGSLNDFLGQNLLFNPACEKEIKSYHTSTRMFWILFTAA